MALTRGEKSITKNIIKGRYAAVAERMIVLWPVSPDIWVTFAWRDILSKTGNYFQSLTTYCGLIFKPRGLKFDFLNFSWAGHPRNISVSMVDYSNGPQGGLGGHDNHGTAFMPKYTTGPQTCGGPRK